jgi:hypothetical protein
VILLGSRNISVVNRSFVVKFCTPPMLAGEN